MIDQPILEKKLLPEFGKSGKTYKKWKQVEATKATREEKVKTITSNGKETENIARKGDYIVKNMTEANERYVIEPKKFKKLYLKTKSISEDVGIYLPKGKVNALKINKHILDLLEISESPFEIKAPWGALQTIRLGDYLVMPEGELAFYGIAKKEFHETYILEDDAPSTTNFPISDPV